MARSPAPSAPGGVPRGVPDPLPPGGATDLNNKPVGSTPTPQSTEARRALAVNFEEGWGPHRQRGEQAGPPEAGAPPRVRVAA